MSGNALLRLLILPLLSLLATACAGARALPATMIQSDAHHGNGTVVAFAHAAGVFASGGSDGRLRLWRVPDGAALAGWTAHDGSIHGIAFLDRDRKLLTAGYDGRLALWSRDGTPLRGRDMPSPVTAMAADETAGLVVTGHDDGRVRLWRLADLAPLSEHAFHRGYVRAVTFHRATGRLASSGADGGVLVWRRGEPPQALAPPPSDARELVFTHDGKFLLGGGWFKLFRWNLADGALQVLPTAHGGIIAAIDLSADGRTLASISRQTDSAVHLLDPETGALRLRLQPHELCGTSVRLSADGRYLASTSDDGSVRLWDLKTAESE